MDKQMSAFLILSGFYLFACSQQPRVPSPPSTIPITPPDLGIGARLNGYRPFPANNPWNTPVDNMPVDPNSANLIASIGVGARLHPDFGSNPAYGIPYIVIAGNTPLVPITFSYANQSDPGPYPIPTNAPIEGGASASGDRHVIIFDRDHHKLYEIYAAYPQSNGSWTGGSGAIFNTDSNALRPAGWTSADAAGLPIFPGLARYEEVVTNKKLTHALRFTAVVTRHAYTYPARHYASSNTDPNTPPMGMRVRLKASFNTSGYSGSALVILKGLKKYGMILADNGSNWFFGGATDSRWNDNELNTLKNLHGSDFEVVQMGAIITQ